MANAIKKAIMVMIVAFIIGVLKEFKYTEFISDIDFGIEKLFKFLASFLKLQKLKRKNYICNHHKNVNYD